MRRRNINQYFDNSIGCLIKLENLFSNATKYRKLTSLHDYESYVGDVKFTSLGGGWELLGLTFD